MTLLPQHIRKLVWVLQNSRLTRMVSLALLAALLVGQSPSAWSQPPTPAEAMRVAQAVPEFEPLTITGVLDESSQVLDDGRLADFHAFEGVAGQIVIIDLISDEFGTLLVLSDSAGEAIATDIYSGEGTNARLALRLPTTGAYLTIATSFNPGEMGQYRLTLQPGTAADVEQAEKLAEVARLNNQGFELLNTGRYSEAEPLLREAVAIAREQFGDRHPQVGLSLSFLAMLHVSENRFGEAVPLFEEALDIFRQRLSDNHTLLHQAIDNLAVLYFLLGRYAEAEPLLQETLAIRREHFGDQHPYLVSSLNNLGAIYQGWGRYAEAESFYQQVLAIRREQFGDRHPEVASSLHDLASTYADQVRYWEAEFLYKEALAIRREQLGNSPAETLHERYLDVAGSLSFLAGLYQIQGRYEEAESLIQEGLAIRREQLDERHADVDGSLNALAELYRLQRRYEEAEPLYQEALAIRREQLGDRHINIANSLGLLAKLYYSQGRYGEAEPLYQEALTIARDEQLGVHQLGLANTFSNLASIYQAQGRYGEVDPLYQEALIIRREQLGDRHPDVATSLNNLAALHQAKGDIHTALTWFQQGLAIEEANLSLNLAIGSDSRKRDYIATISSTTDFALSLHLQDANTNPTAARLALTTVLRRKGRVLDAVTDTQQLLRQNLSPDLAPLLDEFTTVQTQLANQLYAGLGDQDPAAYRTRIDQLRQEANRLENELSRRSAEFRVETEPVEIEAVQALIPADAALVELVQYRPFNPAASQSERWGNPRYAAYILHSSGDPRWVDLGDAETIDTAARAFLAATRTPNSLSQARTTARALDELVMAPIRPLLGDATHLLLSPDSQLNLVPFAALLDEQDRYLVETYTLTHLTTGRDLLRLQNPAPSQQPPVIFANPNYDTADPSSTQLIAAASTSPRPGGEGPGVRAAQRSGDIADLRFDPLLGTQQEVDAIAPLLPDNAIILTGANATENALKQVQAPSILHIATHGFFLEDVEFVPPPRATRGDRAAILVEPITPAAASSRLTSNENPLLRSGLAMAGFNSRDSAGEDGVLTALEATGLNLRGTRLVVMSACETGVGQVANGEGVYGLRRAFVMAGAESQLMSLWKVDDFGTAELMQRYYQRLQNGEGRSEALRQVQLEFLEAPAYQHPYYWASFLFSGEWSPMSDR